MLLCVLNTVFFLLLLETSFSLPNRVCVSLTTLSKNPNLFKEWQRDNGNLYTLTPKETIKKEKRRLEDNEEQQLSFEQLVSEKFYKELFTAANAMNLQPKYASINIF